MGFFWENNNLHQLFLVFWNSFNELRAFNFLKSLKRVKVLATMSTAKLFRNLIGFDAIMILEQGFLAFPLKYEPLVQSAEPFGKGFGCCAPSSGAFFCDVKILFDPAPLPNG